MVGADVEVWLLRGNCKYLEYAGTLRELTDMTRQYSLRRDKNFKHEGVFWIQEYVVAGADVEMWLLRDTCKYLDYAGALRELTDMTRQYSLRRDKKFKHEGVF